MNISQKLLLTLCLLATLQSQSALAMKRDRKEKETETTNNKKRASQKELNESLFDAIQQLQVKDNLDAIKELLEQGADANMIADEGTLLSYAVAEDNIELARLLLKHKANINAPSGQFGMTPLAIAAQKGLLPMCKFLIQNNADVQQEDGLGFTPWSRANDNGHQRVCTLLQKNGAQKQAVPTEDPTPTWVLNLDAFARMSSNYGKKKGKK